MSKQNNYQDILSPSVQISALSMEAQQEANRIEHQRLKLENKKFIISIITVIIAAVAAIASSANLIISIVEKLYKK